MIPIVYFKASVDWSALSLLPSLNNLHRYITSSPSFQYVCQACSPAFQA
jgi:hypothetical protein